jgi:hypothetical protein
MAEASSNAVIAARTMERSGWAESIRTIKEWIITLSALKNGYQHQQTYKKLFGACTSLYKLAQACTSPKSAESKKCESQVKIFASEIWNICWGEAMLITSWLHQSCLVQYVSNSTDSRYRRPNLGLGWFWSLSSSRTMTTTSTISKGISPIN